MTDDLMTPFTMIDPLDPSITHELHPFLDDDDNLFFRIDGEITLSAQDAHDALATPDCDETDPICMLHIDLMR